MQNWTELLQMLNVTTTDSHGHVGSQALGEVRRRRLVDVFLWYSFSQTVCRASFNPVVVLGSAWVYGNFSTWRTDVIVQRVQSGEFGLWSHLFFSVDASCLQSVLHYA